MLERTVILPQRDNEGKSLASQRAAIELELCAIAGGWTRERVSGAWLDKGKLYRDANYRYTLAVDEGQDAAIMARVPAWCARLRQLALYTSRRACDVAIVSAKSQGSAA